MQIKKVNLSDIPAWLLLSKEYDGYILKIAPNLIEWYEGNETSFSFENYMKVKIQQSEAFMATNNDGTECSGIIAISKTNNRITFFAVSHDCDFFLTGQSLLNCAFVHLNLNSNISANIIKSNAKHIENQYILFDKFNFIYSSDSLENDVPVSVMIRMPQRA